MFNYYAPKTANSRSMPRGIVETKICPATSSPFLYTDDGNSTYPTSARQAVHHSNVLPCLALFVMNFWYYFQQQIVKSIVQQILLTLWQKQCT